MATLEVDGYYKRGGLVAGTCAEQLHVLAEVTLATGSGVFVAEHKGHPDAQGLPTAVFISVEAWSPYYSHFNEIGNEGNWVESTEEDYLSPF